MAIITNNISGSSSDSWRIAITGSVIISNPGAAGDASGNAFVMPGSDVNFFVSGSKGGKGGANKTVAVFGGDTVISGSLTVGTGSITVTSNEIQFLGGATKIYSGSGGLTFSDSSGTKTLSSLATGGGDVTGPGSSTDTAIVRFNGTGGKTIQDSPGVTIDSSNNVVTSGSFSTKNGSGVTVVSLSNGGVISGSNNLQVGGNITVAGNIDVDAAGNRTLFASAGASTFSFGGTNTTLVVNGDLNVRGSTTTISSSNLVVKDSMIYFGSGSTSSNQNGGIALASGSSVASQALVWGRVANDVWGAGRLDVTAGTTSDLTAMSLLPVRASSFQVGGATAVVTSSDGAALTVGGTSTTMLSGSAVNLNASSTGVGFQADAVSFLTVTSGSYSNAGNAAKIVAATSQALLLGAADTKRLYLSGSQIVANAGASGLAVQRDGTAVGALLGTANTSFTLLSADGSGVTKQLTVSGSTVIIGANSQIIKMQGSSGNDFLTFTNDGSDNATVTGLAAKNVTLGSGTGSTVMTVSGSTVALNGGVVNLQKDGTTYAFVGTSPDSLNGLMPNADVTYNLGSPQRRWQNIYTGDLHLRNDRGDYTLIEEPDFLSIRFNKTGKRYKFLLERVPELDESVE